MDYNKVWTKSFIYRSFCKIKSKFQLDDEDLNFYQSQSLKLDEIQLNEYYQEFNYGILDQLRRIFLPWKVFIMKSF